MTKRQSPSRQEKLNLLSEKISNLYHQGYSDPEIAKILGKSNSYIQYFRQRHLKLKAHMPEETYKNEVDRIKGYMIRNIKFSAKRRGFDFDLTYHDFDLPIYCPLLNIPLSYNGERGTSNNMNRATIDRIDNSKGYIKENVWVIARLANAMKNQATLEELELFAKNILLFVENQRARGSITDSESLDS